MPVTSGRARARGSMLIIALGVLTLLSIMAVTFWTLMHYEKNAATNYVDGVKAKLCAEAGLQAKVADMKNIATEPPFDAGGRLKPFIWGGNGGKEMNVAKRVEEVDPKNPYDAYFYQRIGMSYQGKDAVDECRVKVVDTSALFDLNYEPFERETAAGGTGKPVRGQMLELMLEELGRGIAQERAGKNLEAWDPVNGPLDPKSKRKPVSFAGYSGASAILAYRATLDGMRFSSKTQLQEIMEEASYQILAEYVTAHGAVDDMSIVAKNSPGYHNSAKRLMGATRASINANLAPKAVLVASIAPLAGRRRAYMVTRKIQEMEAQDPNGTGKANYAKGPASDPAFLDPAKGLKEETEYDVREGWLYVGPFGTARASAIADWIISQRPFLGAADFYARVSDEMRKPGGGALGGQMPPAQLIGKDAPVATPGARIFPPQGQQVHNLTGIDAMTPQGTIGTAPQPYFKQLVRDAGYSLLLANFNPAFVATSAVPNSASNIPIDKGSLLFPIETEVQNGRDGVVLPRQSFEFCYDTRGIFEVTALGQIRKAFAEIVAQEKILTVVRLLGEMTHRTQFDFERNDAMYTSGAAAGSGRTGMATFPNPRRTFTAPGAPIDEPDPTLASSTWGHVEVDVRSIYADGIADAPGLFEALKIGKMGTAIFGSVFEWHAKGIGWPQAYALSAYKANNGGDIFTDQAQIGNLHFNKARGTLPPLPPRPGNPFIVSDSSGTLYNDGIHLSYRENCDNTLWYRAGASTDSDGDQGALPLQETAGYTGAPLESTNGSHKEGNVWYRKGGLEFWYKPEFDWAYPDDSGAPQPFPLFCGYVFASRVYYNPGQPGAKYANLPMPAPIKGPDSRGLPTDGTQLYLFRNTEGQLRATRLFFRVVGKADKTDVVMSERPSRFRDPQIGDQYGEQTHPEYPGEMSFMYGPLEPNDPAEGGAIETYRRAAEREPFDNTNPAKPTGYPWPPLEFAIATGATGQDAYKLSEQDIKKARVDAYVPFDRMASWRAGEWHHIAMYWDDTIGGDDPQKYLKIFVDGRHQSDAKIIGEDKNMFCRLNEPPDHKGKKYPQDKLMVGCIERRIAKTNEGVFKHPNTVNPGKANPVLDPNSDEAREIHLFACGVIDDFITYDGTTDPGASLPGIPTRFEQAADYVQHFDLTSRMPGNGKPLELARLSWTVLLPRERGRIDIGQPVTPLIGGSGLAEIKVSEPANIELKSPSGQATTPIAFRTMRDYGFAKLEQRGSSPAKPGLLYPDAQNRAKLRYEISLKATGYGPGPFSVGQLPRVDTPALEEVSVIYVLPTEETLLKERIVD